MSSSDRGGLYGAASEVGSSIVGSIGRGDHSHIVAPGSVSSGPPHSLVHPGGHGSTSSSIPPRTQSIGAAGKGALVQVAFRLHAAVNFGETVVVCGDTPSLGAWVPERGIPLVTKPDLYPTWYCRTPVALPANTVIHYKYLINSGGVFERWETIAGNRELTTTREPKMIVLDSLDQRRDDDGAAVPAAVPFYGSDSGSEAAGAGSVSHHAGASRHPTHRYLSGASSTGSANTDELSTSVDPRDHDDDATGGSGGASSSGLRRRADDRHLMHTDHVIIVGWRLPVILHRSAAGRWTAEWDYEALLSVKQQRGRRSRRRPRGPRFVWVGTPEVPGGVPEEERPAVRRLLERLDCHPVFVDPAQEKDHYEGFCRGTLWGVLHNIVDVYSEHATRWVDAEKHVRYWNAYTAVNRQFAQSILEVYTDSSIVWVHDYPLLMVPAALARVGVRGAVGLFLHTPFPSSEIFRTLSVREDILHGMLAASHIGFHLFEYARHFTTSCRRIVGTSGTVAKPGGLFELDYAGRRIRVTVSHVGLEPQLLSSRLQSSEVAAVSAAYKERFRGKLVMSHIDNLAYMRGIPLKLLAFETMLQRNPSLRGKVALYQVGVRSVLNEPVSDEVMAKMRGMVARINETFGAGHVSLEERGEIPSLNERLGLWAATDVFISTSIRAGLNLFPLEYVYAHNSPPGVLIISEFVGASRVLLGSLRVNPWRRDELARTMADAFNMPEAMRTERQRANFNWVMSNSASVWGERLLCDVKASCVDTRQKQKPAGHRRGSTNLEATAGLGNTFRVLGMGNTFTSLTSGDNEDEIGRAYSAANKRVLMFDYGGTLAEGEGLEYKHTAQHPLVAKILSGMGGKERATPMSKDLRAAFATLARDTRNRIFIISGQRREVLERDFGHLPEIGLAAENGFFYRWGVDSRTTTTSGSDSEGGHSAAASSVSGSAARAASGSASGPAVLTPGRGSSGTLRDGSSVASASAGGGGDSASITSSIAPGPRLAWKASNEHEDAARTAWKGLVRQIMNVYAMRTNGAFVQEKGSSVVWYFGGADEEFGALQSQELTEHLREVLKNLDLKVQRGSNYVEVRPKGINKAVMVQRIVERIGSEIDFCLCIGDDESDEPMFSALESLHKRYTTLRQTTRPQTAWTARGVDVAAATAAAAVRAAGAGSAGGAVLGAEPSESPPAVGGGDSTTHSDARGAGADGASRRSVLSPTSMGDESPAAGGATGHAATEVGHTLLNARVPDFAQEEAREHDDGPSLRAEPITITVGMKPSKARFYVDDMDQVATLIRSLAKRSAIVNRARSMTDLPRAGGGSLTGGRTRVRASLPAAASQLSLSSKSSARLGRSLPPTGRGPLARIGGGGAVGAPRGLALGGRVAATASFRSLTLDTYMSNISEEPGGDQEDDDGSDDDGLFLI